MHQALCAGRLHGVMRVWLLLTFYPPRFMLIMLAAVQHCGDIQKQMFDASTLLCFLKESYGAALFSHGRHELKQETWH